MATIPDVADAIVVVLNDASLTQEFTAKRVYLPISKLKDITDLTVSVVPLDQEISMATRSEGQRDMRIDIGIQQKLDEVSNTEIDVLMDLVEEIIELIRTTRRFGVAVWMGTENNPIYAPEHLSELGVFTSVLTLSLRTLRT